MENKKMVKYNESRIAYVSTKSFGDRHLTIIEKPHVIIFYGFPTLRRAKGFFEVIDEQEVEVNLQPTFFHQSYHGELFSMGFFFTN